jgi:serine/threonine protein kinase
MKLHTLLLQNKRLWNSFHTSTIEQYYEHQTTPWAQGGSSEVFLLSNHRLCKRETLFAVPSPHNNDSLYQKGNGFFYLKESFLIEALVMETLHPVLPTMIPKVYDYKFGQLKDGTWVSVIIMEKIEGAPYPPTPFAFQNMKSLWVPFFHSMKQLYHEYSFIHGDLIFRNIKVRNGEMVLIDFGLSSLVLDSVLFCRYHSFQRCINQMLGDPAMLQQMRTALTTASCHDLLGFVQEHRQGVDICALLGRFLHQLPPSIVNVLLNSCIGGRTSRLQQTTMTHQPFPMSYSRIVITYEDILSLFS